MALHAVTRSALALAFLGAGVAAQGTAPSALTSLAANAATANKDTWVRVTKSAAVILKQQIAVDLRNVCSTTH